MSESFKSFNKKKKGSRLRLEMGEKNKPNEIKLLFPVTYFARRIFPFNTENLSSFCRFFFFKSKIKQI